MFRMYFIIAGILAVMAFLVGIKVHFDNDAERKVELSDALGLVVILEEANSQAENSNAVLTERVKGHNAEKLATKLAADQEIEASNKLVAEVKLERTIIKEQLEVANFTILEAIRDDEDYEDWAYGDTHITVWDQLRDAAKGESSIQTQ